MVGWSKRTKTMDGKGVFLLILDVFCVTMTSLTLIFHLFSKFFYTFFICSKFFYFAIFLFRGVRPTANIFKLETFFWLYGAERSFWVCLIFLKISKVFFPSRDKRRQWNFWNNFWGKASNVNKRWFGGLKRIAYRGTISVSLNTYMS